MTKCVLDEIRSRGNRRWLSDETTAQIDTQILQFDTFHHQRDIANEVLESSLIARGHVYVTQAMPTRRNYGIDVNVYGLSPCSRVYITSSAAVHNYIGTLNTTSLSVK